MTSWRVPPARLASSTPLRLAVKMTPGSSGENGPGFGHPAGDRGLVALGGAAGRALQAVAQPLPHVPGMVGNPRELLDHGGDAVKGPVVGVEAVRAGTLPQRLVDGGELGVG